MRFFGTMGGCVKNAALIFVITALMVRSFRFGSKPCADHNRPTWHSAYGGFTRLVWALILSDRERYV